MGGEAPGGLLGALVQFSSVNGPVLVQNSPLPYFFPINPFIDWVINSSEVLQLNQLSDVLEVSSSAH